MVAYGGTKLETSSKFPTVLHSAAPTRTSIESGRSDRATLILEPHDRSFLELRRQGDAGLIELQESVVGQLGEDRERPMGKNNVVPAER